MEYFITNLGKSYPLCRFPDGCEAQRNKSCFKCADNPGLYDGEPIVYHEDLCKYDGNGECFAHTSDMLCVRVCPYSCITVPCPESRSVAKNLCSVEELNDEEKAYFEEEFEILVKEEKERFEEKYGEETERQSQPDFKLLSMKELDLTSIAKKIEHDNLLEEFDELADSHTKIPAIRFMMECQELAKKIRKANQINLKKGKPKRSESPDGDKKYEAIVETLIDQHIEKMVEGEAEDPITIKEIVSQLKKMENFQGIQDDSLTKGIQRTTAWKDRKKTLNMARREAGMGATYEKRKKKGDPYQKVQ